MSNKEFQPGGNTEDALRPIDGHDHLLLRIENLSKQYSMGGGRTLTLFQNLSFSVAKGQIAAIVGPSGAGKSSLLHLIAALDSPTSGSIDCNGTAVNRMSKQQAARFRNREIGYVWQFHYLLPEFTAIENVAMPLLARGLKRVEAHREACSWLERVGLPDRLHHRAGELSGGEQQRVSLARALITKPKLLLADEPTGDLDEGTAAPIFDLIEQLHREQGLTTVLVTHNIPLARRCHRVLRLTHQGISEVPAGEL